MTRTSGRTKRSIDAVDVRGRSVLMRVDFNVPLGDDGRITDDRRLRSALPTILSVVDRGGRLVMMSHLGRPRGDGPEPGLSLRPLAERLRELLPGVTVRFAPDDPVGEEASRMRSALADGEVLLLENLRFAPGEKTGDEAFARALAAGAEIYCHNAFGTAHRSDASMVAVPRFMEGRPRVAGLLLQRELAFLSNAIMHAERPFVAVLGGAKVSDKLGAIENLLPRVDVILVGGAMAYTFLAAQGLGVGASLVEDSMRSEARSILDRTAGGGIADLILPADHVCGMKLEAGTPVRVFTEEIDDGWSGFDIGPDTAVRFGRRIRTARTIVWNGPLGVFELPPFDAGSRQVAEAMAAATAGGALSVIGGGDTAAAVEAFGLADEISHVSTGGGASLQMLEGRSFASVDLLEDA